MNFLNFYIILLVKCCIILCILQVHSAIQQSGFLRVKRGLRKLTLSHVPPGKSIDDLGTKLPTDPYFPLQWYLRNTGQNGGKARLDLNVQDAWAQGITGKNVTTAIMDDGKYITIT